MPLPMSTIMIYYPLSEAQTTAVVDAGYGFVFNNSEAGPFFSFLLPDRIAFFEKGFHPFLGIIR